MDYKSIIRKSIDYIKDNKFDDAINFLYQKKDSVMYIFKDYSRNIENESEIIDIKTPFSDKILIDYINQFFDIKDDDNKLFTIILRLSILKLINIFHKLKLREKNEIKNPKTNINYIVTIADNNTKLNLFILYLLVFDLEIYLRKKYFKGQNKLIHVGIDYEFTARQIALMQINFECFSSKKSETNSYIWLINPAFLDITGKQFLIRFLMTNKKIYKIVQGADSLDIPYVYAELLNNNKDSILNFTKKVIDTRFLCEYFRLSMNEERKCSIYDALLYFNTISEEKYNELIKINEAMGPVQDIVWTINKLSSFHIKYALYDVLFLKHFLFDIFNRIKTKTPENVQTYNFIVPLMRFIFVERRNVTTIINEAKKDISPINNYLIKKKNQNITLITIYNTIIKDLKIPYKKSYIDVNFILSINYFKNTISILLKKIVYYLIIQQFIVYKNKFDLMKEKFSLDKMYNDLSENKFYKIIKFLDLFKKNAKNKIISIYR